MQLRLTLIHSNALLQRVMELETASYPADEAASEEQVRFRNNNARDFFLAAYPASASSSEDIVGFVNGTLTSKDELEEESMSVHDKNGTTLCIHSVVVSPKCRRQGIALSMVKQYIEHICATQPTVKNMVLLSKAKLVELYTKCGFSVKRLSPVTHGQDPWMEMWLDCAEYRKLPFYQVDAFTSQPFEGNPAAVVVLPKAIAKRDNASEWMQRVAIENNLSETAFIYPSDDQKEGASSYELRWFKPNKEVDICGHATLASAYALYNAGHAPRDLPIHFHTLSGLLQCTSVPSTVDPSRNMVGMDFPRGTLSDPKEGITRDEIARALNLSPNAIVNMFSTSVDDILVHVEPTIFDRLQPNWTLIDNINCRGVSVTSEASIHSGVEVDFQSRFLRAQIGDGEDAVTGSAHCALATYWSDILVKSELYAQQACPERGGFVAMELNEDKPDSVFIKGEAAMVLQGKLCDLP